MNDDCIDPTFRESLQHIQMASQEELAQFFSQEPGTLGENRLHLRSCPNCRIEFESLHSMLDDVNKMVVAAAAETLVDYFNKFAGENFPDAAENVSRLLEAGRQVQLTLSFFLERWAMFTIGDASDGERTPLTTCSKVLCSFAPEVQQFVATSIMTEELLGNATFRCHRLSDKNKVIDGLDAIMNERAYAREAVERTGIPPLVFLTVVELAAKSYLTDMPSDTQSALAQRASASPALVAAMKRMMEEVLNTIADDGDSLKAGQMEILRLIEHNRKRAVHYESYVRDCLGEDIYEQLAEATRRALCVGEYLLNLIMEPGCYAAPALSFCEAYEKELTVRVFWPVIEAFRTSGIHTYDANGFGTRPLLLNGQVPQTTFTLGTLAWYLKNAADVRAHVSRLGLNVDVIAADAHSVSVIRNKAAHETAVPTSLVLDLKDKMLKADGMIRHLHISGNAAAGSR
jgi:hypothetical protein